MSVYEPTDMDVAGDAAADPNNVPASLEALYRAHWKEICGVIARTFGPGPPEPEDAAQAAFAKYAAIGNKDEIDNPRAFLFQMARNFVLDERRKLQTQRRHAPEVEDIASEPPAQGNPLRVLEGKERLAAILATVHNLEPRRRKVLIWHAIHELTFGDIATRLGVSKTRVRQYFAEALAACEATARSIDNVANDGDGE